MLRTVQASSLPAQAETEGVGGSNGFLRRQQLPAPHGPFRRPPLMRSAPHGPRGEPALRGRGGSVHGDGLWPGRAPPAGAAERSAAAAAAARMSSHAAQVGGAAAGGSALGRGKLPRWPWCYCGLGRGEALLKELPSAAGRRQGPPAVPAFFASTSPSPPSH